MSTGILIRAGECNFCGGIEWVGLFHTCTTAPKPKKNVVYVREEYGPDELSPEEEEVFYRKVLHSKLLCSDKKCSICNPLH